MSGRCVRVWTALLLTGCGSVAIPDQQFYRFAAPAPLAGHLAQVGVLRVERLEVAAHLAGDRLLVAEGPVLVRPYHFHQWAGPLDALVGDALRTGLARSRAFAQVKGPGDPGSSSLVLSGRILEFCQVVEGTRWVARAVLELRLVDTATGRVAVGEEFRSDVVLSDRRPEALVRGLSDGLGLIVDRLLVAATEAGLFAPPVDSAPPR